MHRKRCVMYLNEMCIRDSVNSVQKLKMARRVLWQFFMEYNNRMGLKLKIYSSKYPFLLRKGNNINLHPTSKLWKRSFLSWRESLRFSKVQWPFDWSLVQDNQKCFLIKIFPIWRWAVKLESANRNNFSIAVCNSDNSVAKLFC